MDSYEELGNEYRHVVHQMLIDVRPSIKDTLRLFFERLRLWSKVKMFLSRDDSSNRKTVSDLLQALKYSSRTASFSDELRRAFAQDADRSIDDTDFQHFFEFAQTIREEQRTSLQSFFNQAPLPHDQIRQYCTIEQWAHLRYRLVRLEEASRLIEAKLIYALEHSEELRRTGERVVEDE